VKVYYFGPWGEPGHYLFLPNARHRHPRPEQAGPWTDGDLDASSYKRGYGRDDAQPTGRGFCPPDPDEKQGVWKLTHGTDAGGATWTAIGAWDRTCDPRGQCKAVFIAEGEHDEQAMRAIAEQHFPAVWARIQGGAR
jgi:hypothetical protein